MKNKKCRRWAAFLAITAAIAAAAEKKTRSVLPRALRDEESSDTCASNCDIRSKTEVQLLFKIHFRIDTAFFVAAARSDPPQKPHFLWQPGWLVLPSSILEP